MKTERKAWKEALYHILVTFGAVIMVYPLLWMVFSSSSRRIWFCPPPDS